MSKKYLDINGLAYFWGKIKAYVAAHGGGGVTDYDQLTSRPQINSTTLTGNQSSSDLGVADEVHTHTKSEIIDFPTIPTNTSDLNNDSGFISASGLVAEEVLLADNITISGQTYGNGSKSVTKTGYTPIAIAGMHLQNASTGGQNNTTCAMHSWYLSGSTAYWIVRGTTTATAKIKVTATVLYVKA